MLKVDNLKKSFGAFQAVKGISFEVKKGEVLGFLGPNGAGKSTTMRDDQRLLCDLERLLTRRQSPRTHRQ